MGERQHQAKRNPTLDGIKGQVDPATGTIFNGQKPQKVINHQQLPSNSGKNGIKESQMTTTCYKEGSEMFKIPALGDKWDSQDKLQEMSSMDTHVSILQEGH